MKRALLVLPLLLLMGCEGPVSNKPASKLETQSFENTRGLEGCTLFEHDVKERSTYPIYIVRCQSLDTTSLNTTQGDDSKQQTTIIVDEQSAAGTPYTETSPAVVAPQLNVDLTIGDDKYMILDASKVIEVNGQKYIKI